MPRANVGDWIARWLQAKELENGSATADRCGIVERFKISLYTHLSADDLRGAVNALPDVTKG